MLAAEIYAGMEPGAAQYGRNVGRFLDIRPDRELLAGVERGELLRVPLFHQAEAAELAFNPVEVTVVVSVVGDEAVAADAVVGFDALDHMDGKGNLGDPGFPFEFVGEVELGRRRVL